LEFVLQPTPGNQPKSETPPDGVAETTPQKNIWRPLEALLKLRGLEAALPRIPLAPVLPTVHFHGAWLVDFDPWL
jgi:hypothetical protein